MLRRIRITLATLTLIGLTLLFLDISGYLYPWTAWLAKIQFLPAVLALNVPVVIGLILLTLLFGRIYCSIICPLGILQDLLARLRPRKNKKVGRYGFSPEMRWLRYPVLVLFIIALVAGVGSFVALLAPYSSFGRIAVNLFKPIYELGNNLLAGIAEKQDSYAFYHVDVWVRSLPTFIIAAVTFIILAILAWIGGRTYCNTICPVGTILSFLARRSVLKINFNEEKCRNCSACAKACKASCIDYKNHTVDYSRCVVCGNCIDSCKFGALKYDAPRLHQTHEANGTNEPTKPHEQDASRRAFLLSSATALATATLAQEKIKMDGGLADIEDKVAPERKTPLTPPGSFSARHLFSSSNRIHGSPPYSIIRQLFGTMLMNPVFVSSSPFRVGTRKTLFRAPSTVAV